MSRFLIALCLGWLVACAAPRAAVATAEAPPSGPPCFDLSARASDELSLLPSEPVTAAEAAEVCALLEARWLRTGHRVASARHPNGMLGSTAPALVDVVLARDGAPDVGLRAVVRRGPQGLFVERQWVTLGTAGLVDVEVEAARAVVERVRGEGWNAQLTPPAERCGPPGTFRKPQAPRTFLNIAASDGKQRWGPVAPEGTRFVVQLQDTCRGRVPADVATLFVGEDKVLAVHWSSELP